MIPPGFEELHEDSDIFYRVEPDGSVLLTGEKAAGVINQTLPDGSKLIGGINRQGLVFGDRITNERGQFRKYKIYWRDVETSPRLAAALAAQGPRPEPKPVGQSPLDNPIFDPALPKKWPKAERPAREWNKDLQQDPRPLLEEAAERVDRALATKSNITGRVKTLLRRKKDKGQPEEGAHVTALEEAGELISQTMAAVEQVRGENADLLAEMQRAEAENQALRNELERVRSESKQLLEQTIEEFGRRVKVRRWQVEAAPSQDVVTEGMSSQMLEVDDPDGAVRYIIVSSVPPGTNESVVKQWQDDLRAKVDKLPFAQNAVYVIAPNGFKVSVLELIPGVEADAAQQQF